MPPDVITEQTKEQGEETGGADILFGVPSCDSAETMQSAVSAIRTAIKTVNPSLKAVLAHADGITGAEARQNESEPADSDPLTLLPTPLLSLDRLRTPMQILNDAHGALFSIAASLGARACVVIGSEPANVTVESLERLLEPLVGAGFDLVIPCYARKRFEGLINNSLVYPLTRALYGKRVRYPFGMDFGFSARLIQRYLQSQGRNGAGSRDGPPIWLVSDAVRAGLQVCQTYLNAHLHAAREPTELSTVLAQVVGALFTDLERNAAFWQKVRGSQPLTTFGKPAVIQKESSVVDVRPMIESFQLGVSNLSELWGAILPPATLFELKKLSSMPVGKFSIADDWWARIVYDFALGSHLRTMSRDHLLRALTPVYLAWVASYASEAQRTPAFNVEQRIEKLCAAFESQKPYLQSRWRWPDRFNP